MSGTFNRRLRRLERDAEIKRAAMMKENEYDISKPCILATRIDSSCM